MKKLIDIPDDIIPDVIKIAKQKRQSVKAYMETAVISVTLLDLINIKPKKK